MIRQTTPVPRTSGASGGWLAGRRLANAGGVAETALAATIRGGLLLLLLTPLVVTPSTVYPFVVGKALYARAIIEVLFGLWVVLAVLAPAYRPRRSAVWLLLAAGLAWGVVAALVGSSPARSLWSTYERMQGLVEAAHWAGLTLVAACVLHTLRQWTALLNWNLAVGVAVAALAVMQLFGGTLAPLLGDWLAPVEQRPYATLGNPVYLGAYLMVNVMLAGGLLVRSFVPDAAPAPGGNPPRARTRAWRTFWIAAAAVNGWALALSAAMGPMLGFLFGIAALASVGVLLARSRRARWTGVGALGAVVALVAAIAVAGAVTPKARVDAVSITVLRKAAEVDVERESVQSRLAAWRAGMAGVAERPLAGWGPENFLVVFGRHGNALPDHMRHHDFAHNALVEELATKGTVGGALYLGLWLATAMALVRAALRSVGKERILVLSLGAALAAHFAAMQTLFATAVGSLHYAMLLAFVVGLQMRARPPRPGSRRVRVGTRIAVVAAAVCVVAAGLGANHALHRAAVALNDARGLAEASAQRQPRAQVAALFGEALLRYEAAVAAFAPLANHVRLHLFRDVGRYLGQMAPRAGGMPAWVDDQAAAAVAAEPGNWLVRLELAHLYAEAADADPGRLEDARRHSAALLAMVRHDWGVLRLFGRPPRPGPIGVAAGRDVLTLDWLRDGGVLTYRVAERMVPGDWRTVYEGVASRAVLPAQPARPRMFRVRGCRGPRECGPLSKPVRIGATRPEPP